MQENNEMDPIAQSDVGEQQGADAAAQPVNPYAAPAQPTSPYAQASAQPGGSAVPPSGYVPGAPAQAPAPQGKGKATGALVCGIAAILLSPLPVVGLVLGIVAIVLATSFLKGGGVAGTAKGGRICGIIGIILSIVMFVFSLVVGFAIFAEVMDEIAPDSTSTSGVVESLTSDEALDANERAARDAVSDQLDKLKESDPAMVAAIADLAERGFVEQTDLTMAECGIDSKEFAREMLRGFDYEITLTIVDPATNEGWVSASIECRDVFDVLDRFDVAISDLSASGELDRLSFEQMKARVGELFMQAARDAGMETDGYFDVDIAMQKGTWVVDQETWDEELDYFFGVV